MGLWVGLMGFTGGAGGAQLVRGQETKETSSLGFESLG